MVALPCYYLTLRARKPRNPAYPEHLSTLGDHIRKRRLDLGLHQKDVAALVNATTSTVTNWEKNRTTPRLYFIPGIIAFLGYDPGARMSKSLGGRIRDFRRVHGMSQAKLARRLGVDPGTLGRWERGEGFRCGKLHQRVMELFEALVRKRKQIPRPGTIGASKIVA